MVHEILKSAIDLRKSLGVLNSTEAVRLFYGPGETDHPALKHLAIDQFSDQFWITMWNPAGAAALPEVERFITTGLAGAVRAIVLMDRSEIATDAEVRTIAGTPRPGRFAVREFGIPYLVQMESTKHPGLFLDHAPLRAWLKETQREKTVLNLFAYTGSLSVAAGVSGAAKVTTIDLSKPTVEWAKENWLHAGLSSERGEFLSGDVFEWLPRLRKRGALYDTILCDPPSFSRSKTGTFSTRKDSARLHEAILPLLRTGGILITSINSENHPEAAFLRDIETAAKNTDCTLRVLWRVDLPPTFPTGMNLTERYLKGFALVRQR